MSLNPTGLKTDGFVVTLPEVLIRPAVLKVLCGGSIYSNILPFVRIQLSSLMVNFIMLLLSIVELFVVSSSFRNISRVSILFITVGLFSSVIDSPVLLLSIVEFFVVLSFNIDRTCLRYLRISVTFANLGTSLIPFCC